MRVLTHHRLLRLKAPGKDARELVQRVLCLRVEQGNDLLITVGMDSNHIFNEFAQAGPNFVWWQALPEGEIYQDKLRGFEGAHQILDEQVERRFAVDALLAREDAVRRCQQGGREMDQPDASHD